MSLNSALARRRRYVLNQYTTIPPLHPTATNWMNRVVANGGTAVSSTTANAVGAFCTGLDTANLTTLLIAVNVIAPDSLIAALTPLIKNYWLDPWTNVSFVSADLSTSGLKGDGASKYLLTGISPLASMSSINSCGLTLYSSLLSLNAGGSIDICSVDNGSTDTLLTAGYDTNSNLYFDAYNQAAGRLGPISGATTGYFSGNRTASNAIAVYRASSTVPHTVMASGSGEPGSAVLPSTQLTIFAANSAGTITQWSLKRLSFIAIHQGFTATQSSSFYSLIQTLRTSFGGGYV